MQRGDMNYVVEIDIEHHKVCKVHMNKSHSNVTNDFKQGSLTSSLAEGSKTVILDSVLRGHNVLFDPTLAFLSYLFVRGVFAKGYKVCGLSSHRCE